MQPVEDGKPGWQSDGSYLTPEGERLKTDLERTAYLRTVQDWIIRPQLKTVPGVAGVDSIGGFQKQYHVQPDPAQAHRARPVLRRPRHGDRKQQFKPRRRLP